MNILAATFLVLFALTACAVGGWFLVQRSASSRAFHRNVAARQTLDKLRQLTTSVAVEMDNHSARVQQLAGKVNLLEGDGEDAVLLTVARLVELNQHMRDQLTSAEEKLHTQAQQIESHVVEARTDALTQIANRRALDDALSRRVDELQRRGQATSVLILDVDHFKKFNDTYGHQAGDDVLRSVAGTLSQQASAQDLVVRYGGEEFIIVFPGGVEAAGATAQRVLAAIAEAPFPVAGRELHVTVSGGLAELQPGESQQDLLMRADQALYASKQAGRRCLHWNDGRSNHPLGTDRKADVNSPARDDLTELLGADWTSASDEMPAVLYRAASTYVSSKTVFVDDLIRRLAQWRREPSPLCLMLVQIDAFGQTVNDYGPGSAALALRVTAQIIKAHMRDMDHVSRLGDDTFALLLPSAGLQDAARCAERLRRAAERCRMHSRTKEPSLSLTIGVVETREGDDMPRILQRGRAALQAAIDNGRNCVQVLDDAEHTPHM